MVETVRRGWSGGTAENTQSVNHSIMPVIKYVHRESSNSNWTDNVTVFELSHHCHVPTLHQKVDYDSVKAQRVGGCAGVVTRILSFDRA